MLAGVQILTPRGYRHPDDMDAGDEVLSRDAATGRLICNRLETRPQWVDGPTFARWWSGRPPAFRFLRINGHFVFSRSQSIWCNGFITHVAHLKVGDVIYTERSGFVRVRIIEDVLREGWWRCDVDGDHSYVLDGVLVHNASRFAVGGTQSWTPSNTAMWSATSGGASGASVPGAADTVTLNGSSGGGTVTPNFGGTITVQSIDGQTHTGTLDFSVNNNSVTLSAGANALIYGGTSARTLRLGDGTWTLTGTTAGQTLWNIVTTTNLTFAANGSTLVFSGNSAGSSRLMASVGLTYNNISFTGTGNWNLSSGSNTFNTFTIGASANILISSGLTATVTSLVTTATPASPCCIRSAAAGASANITCASGTQNLSWVALQDISFAGGATFIANNSFDLGRNSGITINPPPVYPRSGLQAIEQGLVR